MDQPELSRPPSQSLARPLIGKLAQAIPRHIALVGPTASGKTGAALAIANALGSHGGVEIISMDSALVYRGMDIGTAKPTAGELAQVPHHLINIRDPLNAYSAAEFARDAQRLMVDISARGKLPLLVGGTMLYYKALVDGLDDMPPADPAQRAAIDSRARANGWPALHAELREFDPLTAARLSPHDSQRISRAIEVYRLTGRALSAFHNAHKSDGFAPTAAKSRPHADPTHETSANHSLLITLEPADRAWLHARIAARFDTMVRDGFLDEMQMLRARGDLHADLPSMRCVGYRQAWEMLDGLTNAAQWQERAVIATRQLAKRQLTWLRSLPNRLIVRADDTLAMPQVIETATRFWLEGSVRGTQ